MHAAGWCAQQEEKNIMNWLPQHACMGCGFFYLQADKLVQVGLGQHVHTCGEGLGDLRRENEGTGEGL